MTENSFTKFFNRFTGNDSDRFTLTEQPNTEVNWYALIPVEQQAQFELRCEQNGIPADEVKTFITTHLNEAKQRLVGLKTDLEKQLALSKYFEPRLQSRWVAAGLLSTLLVLTLSACGDNQELRPQHILQATPTIVEPTPTPQPTATETAVPTPEATATREEQRMQAMVDGVDIIDYFKPQGSFKFNPEYTDITEAELRAAIMRLAEKCAQQLTVNSDEVFFNFSRSESGIILLMGVLPDTTSADYNYKSIPIRFVFSLEHFRTAEPDGTVSAPINYGDSSHVFFDAEMQKFIALLYDTDLPIATTQSYFDIARAFDTDINFNEDLKQRNGYPVMPKNQ